MIDMSFYCGDGMEMETLSPDDEAAAQSFEFAVEIGDTQFVRHYLDRKEIPSWLTPIRCSKLLRRSIMHKDPTMVGLLLKLQPHFDFESNSNLLSPLWTSIIYTHGEIAKMLIRAGANVDMRFGRNGIHDPECSVMHYLITLCTNPERDDLMDTVVQYGGDVNVRDSKKATPMHYAISMGDPKVISKLLSMGADLNAANDKGETPVLAACKYNVKEEVISLLIRSGADVSAKTHDGLNALHLLANSCDDCIPAAEVFLKHEVSLKELDNDKHFTPLHYAVAKGKENMTKLFLENGADVNSCEETLTLPLFLAAASKSPLVIEMLITKGADIEKTTKKGKTALHIACQNLKEKNIAVLLEYGANINALDHDGATPFSLIEFKNLSMSTQTMIRTFAKFSVINKATNAADLDIIKQYPKLKAFYDDCLKEINEMKTLKLFDDLSYFSMFSKSLVKLALLLRDRRFTFPLKIKRINRLFPLYATDFNRALLKAELLYVDLYCIENRLNAIFSGFAPDPVIREILMALLPYYVHS